MLSRTIQNIHHHITTLNYEQLNWFFHSSASTGGLVTSNNCHSLPLFCAHTLTPSGSKNIQFFMSWSWFGFLISLFFPFLDFQVDPKLQQFSSESYNIKDTDPGKKNCRKKCTMCVEGNHKHRQTSDMHSTCEVPLFALARTKNDNDYNDSCFQYWYEADIL